MNEAEVLELFERSGALLSGHFLLTSGLHSDRYFEKFSVLKHPAYTEALCRALAERFRDEAIDVVVGPAVGGILLAHETAKALGTPALFTEREEGRMVLRRGFAISPGERTLVVEDVVTTGGSVREVLEAVRAQGADVRGVGLLVDRSERGADFGVRTEALLRMPVRAYPPESCPQCRANEPLTARGSRYGKAAPSA